MNFLVLGHPSLFYDTFHVTVKILDDYVFTSFFFTCMTDLASNFNDIEYMLCAALLATSEYTYRLLCTQKVLII